MDTGNLEAAFEQGMERDATLKRWANVVTLAFSIATPIILLVLIIPLGRTSPWLVLLSVYAIATRCSMFVVQQAVLFPAFLDHLDDDDPARRAAARAVLERRRAAVVRPILVAWLRDRSDEAVAAFPVDELARMARERDIPGRRRLAVGWALAWAIVSLAVWGTVIATGGGGTEGGLSRSASPPVAPC